MLAVAESPVEPFHYNLSMEMQPRGGFASKIARRDTFYLRFVAQSDELTPRHEPVQYVHAVVLQAADGADATALKQFNVPQSSASMIEGELPAERPQNGFQFKLEALTIPPSGSLPLRIHFKDHVDEFTFRLDGKGLRLEADKSEYGTVNPHDPIPFTILEVDAAGVVYRASPLGVSAFKDGKSRWSTDIQFYKDPSEIKIVGETVYVATTGGYSLYLLKDTGALLTQHIGLLGGADPVGETIAAGVALTKLPFDERVGRPLFNYYQTGVVLNDRRVIPFLIESVDLGFGLPDKMLAVAGLEKFNGDSDAWNSGYKMRGNALYKSIGMARVSPEAANKAERDRWREIFKDEPGEGK